MTEPAPSETAVSEPPAPDSTPPPSEPTSEIPAPLAPARIQNSKSKIWLLDLFIFLALVGSALPLRLKYTGGDLWQDEADYALAAVRGFEANRWDRPEAGDPEKLIRLRHYHPPGVTYALQAGLLYSREDRILRLPFALAGGLTVGLLYLCGISLFCTIPLRRRGPPPAPVPQEILSETDEDAPPDWLAPRLCALACAFALLCTPAHLRASSHALPWAFITLWLVVLLWTLLKYGETRRAAWLVGTGAALSAMFATSEYFFPTLLAVGGSLPFLCWRDLRERASRKRLLLSLAVGLLTCLLVAWLLWPAGLAGGTLTMLRHYMEMANDPWPVRVRGVAYDRAPKTAYLIWYWDAYRTYVLFYAAGIPVLLGLLIFRRLSSGLGALIVFVTVVVAVAHKSHIIGPEYLVHALPLLTLLGGLALLIAFRLHFMVGIVIVALACAGIGQSRDPTTLSGMDIRSRQSRWPDAARYLASVWQPSDRMLAPAFGGGGRWYLIYGAGISAKEWQVQGLPDSNARPQLLDEIDQGHYPYIAVGSTYADYPSVDNKIRILLRKWDVVWQSNEGGRGRSRLTIYRKPKKAN